MVINSVVQYFPGIDYLVRVLEGAVRAVRPGGAVFVGDVRSLPLLEDFAESVERFQAPPDRSEEEIRRRIRRRVADEEELVIDPAFFQALAERLGLAGADLLDKRDGRSDNELTRYRYDAVLHVGSAPAPLQPGLSWSAFANDPLRTRLARRLVPDLRRHLQSELPDYMVPSSFVLLDSLPVTANGKVDRAALPEPEPARGAGEGTPPETGNEKTMAALWREVLGVDEVHLEDNFFELGGHSLLATQLISRIRTAFGVDLPLRRLFERPVLGDLAAAVESAAPAVPLAASRAPRAEAPLLLAQERFWLFGRQGNVAYNLPMALRLHGRLDTRALAAALREIRRRHATLRTRFVERDGGPVQVIDPPGDWRLPGVDLRGLPEPFREAETRRLAVEDSLRPFDLVRGPVLRAALLDLGPDDHALLLDMHHIVSDGWSMGVLLSELSEIYGALAAGRPSPLPELAVQYADLAAWQRERLSGGVLEARLDWWKTALEGAPRLWSFPTDRPRPAVLTTRGGQVLRPLDPGLHARLQELATAEGASLFMVMLAAYVLVIHGWTGQDDVMVGSPVAGREQEESERLIGAFLSLLPLRVSLAGAPTFRELLRRARRTALDAFAHQEVSFERILEAVGESRRPAYNPLFQCVLNMLVFPSLGGELPGGIDLEPVLTAGAVSKYDFALYARERAEGLLLDLVFATDLFDRTRMERFMDQLIAVLALAADHPDAPLDRFPVAAPDVIA